MGAYQALYRKYRPQTFDDVVGQNAITQTLKTQVVSGKLSHAYLFTGCRGTGKTTCAKILAKAVNCLNPENGNPCNRCKACRAIDEGSCMDVLEIDAASNNGVDNVRDLRDDAVYSPSQVAKRVYIIDEVHMLSTSAFNALLKIVEEPPEHLLFILATTELHKVPATILSRCQRFAFRRIGQEDIASQLQYVAYQESIDLEDSAARVLARLADGAMRDALSLLDQCASAVVGELSAQKVYACLGIAGERTCAELLDKISRHDTAGALKLFNRLYTEGKDLAAMLDELASLVRDILILKTAPDAGISMLSGVSEEDEARALAAGISGGELIRMMELLQKTMNLFTRSSSRRTDAELCILEMSQPELSRDISSINARLTRVEEQLKTGSFVMTREPAPVLPEKKAEPDARQEERVPESVSEPVREETDELPMGFWQDLAASVRKELGPPVSGFFGATANGPIEVAVSGGVLTLRCRDSFTAEIVGREDVLAVVSRKAAVLLDRPVTAKVDDLSKRSTEAAGMSKLMRFGRENPDIVRIKEN